MKNIVLIGMMGSGKSSVGKLLSEKLHFPLIDTDEKIVSNEGKSINTIFAENGESYFRTLERDLCYEIQNMEDSIISTGGGIVLSEENILNLKKNGIVFYLNTTIQTLITRVNSESEARPLINNLETSLLNIFTNREELYNISCDFNVSTDALTEDEVAHNIISIYNSL